MPISTRIKCLKCGKTFISGDAIYPLCPSCRKSSKEDGDKSDSIADKIKSIFGKNKGK